MGVTSSLSHVPNGPSKGYICFFAFHTLHWPKQSPSQNTVLLVSDKCQILSYTDTKTPDHTTVYISLSPSSMNLSGLATWLHSNAQSHSVHVINLHVHHDYLLKMTQQKEVCPSSTKEVSTSNIMPYNKPKISNLKLVLKYTRCLKTSLQCLQLVCVAQ